MLFDFELPPPNSIQSDQYSRPMSIRGMHLPSFRSFIVGSLDGLCSKKNHVDHVFDDKLN